MKIDRRNPAHWVYAGLFGLAMLGALAVRILRKRNPGRPLVVLYGHKLTGNLKALYDALVDTPEFEVVYLTIDPGYRAHLASEGFAAELGFGLSGISALGRTACVVTSHGPQLMSLLPVVTDIRFVDVWHGIPFKGWTSEHFRSLRRYDEIWAPSELLRDIYIDKYGFDPDRVRTTGYGRTDILVNHGHDPGQIKERLGLGTGPVVLFAPTWSHGTNRAEFPFGIDPDDFVSALAEPMRTHGAVCLVRTHLNSKVGSSIERGPIRHLPFDEFPDTESLLLVVDLLVCDWSSLAFDYLLVDRPTIFLDVPAPFTAGFTLGPEFRFGALAKDLEELLSLIDRYLRDPDSYQIEYGERAEELRRSIYGDMADGRASQRYVDALRELLEL